MTEPDYVTRELAKLGLTPEDAERLMAAAQATIDACDDLDEFIVVNYPEDFA